MCGACSAHFILLDYIVNTSEFNLNYIWELLVVYAKIFMCSPIHLKQMGITFLSACLLFFYFNMLTRTISLPDSERIARGGGSCSGSVDRSNNTNGFHSELFRATQTSLYISRSTEPRLKSSKDSGACSELLLNSVKTQVSEHLKYSSVRSHSEALQLPYCTFCAVEYVIVGFCNNLLQITTCLQICKS
jgi:hypothetical protein